MFRRKDDKNMSVPNSKYVGEFVYGKVVKEIREDGKTIIISFLDGSCLRLQVSLKQVEVQREVIAVAYDKDGKVHQSSP